MNQSAVSFVLSVLLVGCSSSTAIRELSEDRVIVQATHPDQAQVRAEANRGCAFHGRTAVPVSHQCVDDSCRTQTFLFACERPADLPASRATPWLGVSVADIADHRYADPPGSSEIVISRVFADGPARKAGLQVGDIIESFNGAPVNTSRQLVDLKSAVGTGERMRFGIRRGNSALRLAMTAQ